MLLLKLLVFFAQFYIGQALCKPTNIEFPVYRMYPKRSIIYYYEARAEPCPGFTTFYYYWYIFSEKMESIKDPTSDNAFLEMNGYKFKDPQVYNKTYGITVRISHYKNFAAYAYDTIYFQFRPDTIKLFISGGHRRTHPLNVILTLSFVRTSRDYSYAPSENQFQKNNFTWLSTPKMDPLPGRQFVWNVMPKNLQESRTYKFHLWMRRDVIPKMIQDVWATQEVIIVRNIPYTHVNCIRNCFYSDSEDETVFSAFCSGNGCVLKDYKWYSTPNVLQKQNIDFGKGYSKLLIKPKVCSPNSEYVFGFTVNGSFAEWKIKYIPNVKAGNCDIKPKSGTVGITYFTIECSGFSSTLGLLTYLVYEGSPTNRMKSVLVKISTNNIITGIRFAGIDSQVTVVVQDPHNKETKVTLSVNLKPYGNIEDAEAKMKLTVLGSGAHTLEWYKLRRDTDGLVQTVSIIMKTLSQLKHLTKNDRNDLMTHIMDNLHDIEFLSISRAKQILSVVPQITSQKLDDDTRTTHRVSIILYKISKMLFRYAWNFNSFYVSLNFVEEFGRRILDAISDLILKNKKILQYLETELIPHYYDSYDDMESEKFRMRRDLLSTMTQVVPTVEFVGRAVAMKLFDNQKEWKLKSKALMLCMRKIKYKDLRDEEKKKLYVNGTLNITRVELTSQLLASLEEKYNTFSYIFALYYQNPFWFHVDNPILNTDGISFTLMERGGSIVSKTEHPVIMYLNITNSATRHKEAITGTLAEKEMVIYRITIRKDVTLMIFFDEYNAKVKYLFRPCLPTKQEVSEKGISQQDFRYEPNVKSPDFMYLAIMNTGSEPIFFNVTVEVIRCINFETSTGSFLKVNWKPVVRNNTLLCQASKFSYFTGILGQLPHWKEEPQYTEVFLFAEESLFMLIILAIVLLLWVFLMVIAFRRDRKLARRNLIFYLSDNVPGDACGYLMIVVTGSKNNSGTTANVGFQLIGSEGTSRAHLIKCDHYEALQENNEDWFIIYCPRTLGEIQSIRLWHDCKGNKPHWYCSRIVVQELCTGQQYCFIVESWFSLILGDSEVYREIPVTPKKCLKSRNIIFPTTLRYNLHNGYLWLSVFSSSPQSNFTTKERVTCLISLLLLSMLVSTLFYGLPTQSATDSIFEHGSFSLSWTEFEIILLTMMVIIPPSILVYILFRKSGPPPLYMKQKKPKDVKDESVVPQKKLKKTNVKKRKMEKPKKTKKQGKRKFSKGITKIFKRKKKKPEKCPRSRGLSKFWSCFGRKRSRNFKVINGRRYPVATRSLQQT